MVIVKSIIKPTWTILFSRFITSTDAHCTIRDSALLSGSFNKIKESVFVGLCNHRMYEAVGVYNNVGGPWFFFISLSLSWKLDVIIIETVKEDDGFVAVGKSWASLVLWAT